MNKNSQHSLSTYSSLQKKPSFPRAASANHLPLDRQFRAVAVAAANAAAAVEPDLSNAVDDEVSQITLGKENQSEVPKEKVDFGLPAHGAFSDPHDSQRQDLFGDRKASISTQENFATPDLLKETPHAGNTSSFEPSSTPHDGPILTSFKDQINLAPSTNQQS